MPNFWRKAGQFINETILKNKTTDEDYQELCNQMNDTELGINSFKSILKNFNIYFEPFCKYIKVMNDSLYQIYKDSPLVFQVQQIITAHESILKDIDNLGKIVSKLYLMTSEWDTIFEKAKELNKTREEKRKNFDHYEQKLLKIEGDQNKKKNAELLIRNQEKYSKALNEYVEISEKSFEVINNSIKLSWELTNPIVGELLISEKNLFEKISSHLVSCGNVKHDFELIMNETFNPEKQEETEKFYDPKKSIRNKNFLKRRKSKNYVHHFFRNTKTFGNATKDKEIKFMGIKDEFSNYSQQ